MGRLLIVESAFLLICVIVALVYQETDIMAFFYTTLITGIAGFLMINFIKIKDRTLAKKDGYFMVTMVSVSYTHLRAHET